MSDGPVTEDGKVGTDWRYLDDLPRAELPGWTKDLADTLDEWNFRMHGTTSSGHHVGAFLRFADKHNITVAGSPTDAVSS